MDEQPATQDAATEAEYGTVFEIPAALLDEAQTKIDKANRRLARGNADARFTFTTEEFVKAVTVTTADEETGRTFDETAQVPYVRITLNAPHLRAEGHTFVAALTQEQGGMLVRVKPGESLAGWERPEDHWCDYCKTRRTRSTSYVVRNEETGEFLQIGKNCVAPFLGVTPGGLWALTYDPAELIPDADEWLSTGGFRHARLYSIEGLLAMAWAVSEEGRKFVSATTARQYEHLTATAHEALDVINWTPMGRVHPAHRARIEMLRAQAAAVPAEIIAELIGYADVLDPESDYGQNMRVALASTMVSHRSVGTVVSLIAVRRRELERQAKETARREREDAIVDEWLGEPKEKIGGMMVTVTHCFEVDGYAYNSTDTIAIMQTASGHVLKWKASGVHDELDTGKRFTLDRATVKAHAEYRGVKQTVVTRCKLTPVEDGAEQDQAAAR